MKIGIPAGMSYYLYYPLWETFFKELGAELVLSTKTNKEILTQGAKVCTSDACIPLKVFHGHVLDISDKVDYLFIPRLKSVAKGEYICPKFCGLPDMVRYSSSSLPPIIDTEINIRKNSKNLTKAFIEAGNYLTKDKKKIMLAADKSLFTHAMYIERLENGYLANDVLENRLHRKRVNNGMTVAVLGHVYNLYDSYINMNLFKKMYDANINAITPEMIPDSTTDWYAAQVPKKIFWTFTRKIIGSAMALADSKKIDGVIYIMSFSCGIDSFTAELCERIFKKKGIPFYLMMIDEHSGEGGFETRFEAFTDMIKWRNKNEGNIPAPREHIHLNQNTL